MKTFLIIFSLSLLTVVNANSYWSWNDWWDNWYNRWYTNPTNTRKQQQKHLASTVVVASSENSQKLKCKEECDLTTDCHAGLSCFEATPTKPGCCLEALKPNQTGCLMDVQCKRACETSHCDLDKTPSRCLCDKGRHYLFKKCWKSCPVFAHKEPVIYNDGHSVCVVKTNEQTALKYMRRHKRQLRSARIFC